MSMKRAFLPGTIALFLCITALSGWAQSSQNKTTTTAVRDRLVGAWRLVELEEEGTDGKVQRADCTGLLVYTREGQMSVQVMYRKPQPKTQGGPVQYAEGGYEASFGRYEINEQARTFTYHVDGALVRSLIGKDLTRSYELSGNRLTVRSSNAKEHWRVTWEHC